jgi:hypothetical protein
MTAPPMMAVIRYVVATACPSRFTRAVA